MKKIAGYSSPLISIIVPVYNVEKFLTRCFESIRTQTYENVEILLIDDGSTDKSGVICDSLAQNDPRVSVIHQNNMGLSEARNTGLNIAKGEFISFIDSDDFIDPTMLETLLELLLQTDTGISMCSIQRVNEAGLVLEKNPTPFLDEVLTSEEMLHQILFADQGWTFIPAWNKLYRRSLFDNLRYPKGKLYEDGFVIHDLTAKAQSISTTSRKLYFYTTRSQSIMKSSNLINRLDGLESRYLQYHFYKDHGLNDCLDRIKELAAKELYLLVMAKKHAKSPSDKNRVAEIASMMEEMQIIRPGHLLARDILVYHISPIVSFFFPKVK